MDLSIEERLDSIETQLTETSRKANQAHATLYLILEALLSGLNMHSVDHIHRKGYDMGYAAGYKACKEMHSLK